MISIAIQNRIGANSVKKIIQNLKSYSLRNSVHVAKALLSQFVKKNERSEIHEAKYSKTKNSDFEYERNIASEMGSDLVSVVLVTRYLYGRIAFPVATSV